MTAAIVSRPTCSGTTKAGERCRSTAIGADGKCFVHGASPEAVRDQARQAASKSVEVRRELAKSGRELMRERLEAEIEDVIAAFRDGTKALGSCPHCGGDLPDARARIQAAAEWLNQSYGKPVQPTEERGRPVTVVLANLRE